MVDPALYRKSTYRGPLRQGEIVSNLIQTHLAIPLSANPTVRPKVHTYAIVISQNCDLDLDFKSRFCLPDYTKDYKFKPGDILWPEELIKRLYNPSDRLMDFLRERSKGEFVRLLENASLNGGTDVIQSLVQAFNKLISSGLLYKSDCFRSILLRESTKKILRQNKDRSLDAKGIMCANRLLLEDIFIHEIKRISRLIPNVLFCEVAEAHSVRYGAGMNGNLWERVAINKDERFHFLQKVTPSKDFQKQGLPELCVDFRCYFTIPTSEVYCRLKSEIKRRCCLASPYLEHFSSRFSYYLSRVGLPRDHESES